MRTLLTVAQLAERCPGFTPASLRWLLFNASENGLGASGAILRNGRRVLLDADKFFAWFEARQGVPAAPRHRASKSSSAAAR